MPRPSISVFANGDGKKQAVSENSVVRSLRVDGNRNE